MNQLADALEKADFTPNDITLLMQSKELSKVRDVLQGLAEVNSKQYTVDCDTEPFIPEYWRIETHMDGGQVKVNTEVVLSIKLYQDECQKQTLRTDGFVLLENLKTMPVLNANVLDHLLVHRGLIPDSWKSLSVFFWGTIYLDSAKDYFVPFLCFDKREGIWKRDFHKLLFACKSHCYAALSGDY